MKCQFAPQVALAVSVGVGGDGADILLTDWITPFDRPGQEGNRFSEGFGYST
jgi:hypothetical protein